MRRLDDIFIFNPDRGRDKHYWRSKTGKQVHSALEAIGCVREIRRANVYSPSRQHREAFVRDIARNGMEVVSLADAKAAVAGPNPMSLATL